MAWVEVGKLQAWGEAVFGWDLPIQDPRMASIFMVPVGKYTLYLDSMALEMCLRII